MKRKKYMMNKIPHVYFKLEPNASHNIKEYIKCNERPKKAQYRMRFPVLHLGFGAIYGFKAKNKFRIG